VNVLSDFRFRSARCAGGRVQLDIPMRLDRAADSRTRGRRTECNAHCRGRCSGELDCEGSKRVSGEPAVSRKPSAIETGGFAVHRGAVEGGAIANSDPMHAKWAIGLMRSRHSGIFSARIYTNQPRIRSSDRKIRVLECESASAAKSTRYRGLDTRTKDPVVGLDVSVAWTG